MGAHPLAAQPGPAGPAWPADPAACNRSYLLAGVRAGLVALVLLVILALIILV